MVSNHLKSVIATSFHFLSSLMLLNANKCQDVTKMNIMFNESVAYIEETMVKLGPFDGVLGMSMVLFF